MRAPGFFIAHTDNTWFDNLSRLATRTGPGPLRLAEANFWARRSTSPLKKFTPGEPMFFRLGAPDRSVVGYGFFADHLPNLDVNLAWRLFGRANGANTEAELARLLGRDTAEARRRPVGCTILREATFWPGSRWLRWDTRRGYADSGLQRGRFDTDPVNVATLEAELALDEAVGAPADLLPRFKLIEVDARIHEERRQAIRQGQGTFRARLLKAYGAQCAITGEHTEPVLDAAHIQPYLGLESNHIQNGLLLTQEFHTLFDRGLVCVEDRNDTYHLRVSELLRERWNNGRRYREYDGQALSVPDDPALRPSLEALAWHREVRFEKVA